MKKTKTTIATIALILTLTFATLITSMPAVSTSTTNVASVGEQHEAFRYQKRVTKYPVLLPRYNSNGNALTQSPGPNTNHTLWISDKYADFSSTPIVAFGRVWIYSDAPAGGWYAGILNELVCLDAYTGEEIWKHTAVADWGGGWAGPALELDDHLGMGYLYAFMGGAFCCFEASDGELIWKIDPEEMADFVGEDLNDLGSLMTSIGPFFKNLVYFCNGEINSHIWAVDKRWGELVWAAPLNASGWGETLALDNGKIYHWDYSCRAHCFNATTGEVLWITNLPVSSDEFTAYSISVVDGRFYLGTTDGVMWCLDADNGKILWNTPHNGYCYCPVYNEGRLYVGAITTHLPIPEDNIYCLDAQTGDIIWKTYVPGGGEATTLADGKVYITAQGRNLKGGGFICLDQETGDLIWQYILPNARVTGDTFSVADGIAYGLSGKGYVYAFGKGPTTTELTVTDANIAKGTTTAINGKVYDESPAHPGAPAVNIPVNLMVQKLGDNNWVNIETVTTDDMGLFITEWTPTTEGTYKIMAKFDGTDSYGWSSGQTVVQVNPAPTTGETDLTSLENSVSDLEEGMSTQTTYILVILVLVIIAIVIAVYSVLKSRK